VFISQLFIERGDELIERYCTAIQNVERRARIAVREQRDTTARARDERSELAGKLSRILLDAVDGGEDPVARALREVGEPALRACVEDPDALSEPIDEQRRDAQHARHSQLAQFAPLVLGALDLQAACGYERLLEAVRYSNRNRDKPVLAEAPLDVLPAVWRRWVPKEDGEVVRTRYELGLWIQARDALRARGTLTSTLRSPISTICGTAIALGAWSTIASSTRTGFAYRTIARFEDAGFLVVAEDVEWGAVEDLSQVDLAARFRRYRPRIFVDR
jgi:hypothetical protein